MQRGVASHAVWFNASQTISTPWQAMTAVQLELVLQVSNVSAAQGSGLGVLQLKPSHAQLAAASHRASSTPNITQLECSQVGTTLQPSAGVQAWRSAHVWALLGSKQRPGIGSGREAHA
jgi:hypothetical protein